MPGTKPAAKKKTAPKKSVATKVETKVEPVVEAVVEPVIEEVAAEPVIEPVVEVTPAAEAAPIEELKPLEMPAFEMTEEISEKIKGFIADAVYKTDENIKATVDAAIENLPIDMGKKEKPSQEVSLTADSNLQNFKFIMAEGAPESSDFMVAIFGLLNASILLPKGEDTDIAIWKFNEKWLAHAKLVPAE